ncbi:putative RNA-binding protein (virulence factor B family) [Rhizobium sp. BK529]|uniref:hypothetical protein n=1 Tax=Rhizobium sp. BK529 TaxID=2586983 RepID=UPI00161A3761|nr:hypothetical protein [Rhizobium sp. BK529]MBB3590694.1 putative RNA-binding protein (virulence factor B family) [Rhizobium sp. BK529]
MYQSSNGSFTPRFKKKVLTESGLVEMEISFQELDSIINHFSKNGELVYIMNKYIELIRNSETSSLSEDEEIAMGRKIFPLFHDFLLERGLMTFAPDVAEEMFQRIEKGLIESEN